MKRFVLPVLLLVACVCSLAPAQTAEQPASADDVARLMNALHVRKQMEEMQKTILAQIKPMLESMVKEQLKGMTPQQRQQVQVILADSIADSLTSYPVEEMIADITPIYQKYLNRADVDAMIAFYSSPTGQKFLQNQPQILGDFMTAMMPKIQRRVQSSTERMQKRIEDLVHQDAPSAGQEYKPAAPAPK